MNCWRQANQSLSFRCCARAELRPLDAGGRWHSADSRCIASSSSFSLSVIYSTLAINQSVLCSSSDSGASKKSSAFKWFCRRILSAATNLEYCSFLCFSPFQKSVLQKLLLDMCLTRALCISFMSAIVTGPFFIEAGCEMQKELISYQHPTKYAADGRARRLAGGYLLFCCCEAAAEAPPDMRTKSQFKLLFFTV